ncbi:MAG TPA: hypothetical protein VNT42_05155 [Sphingomonas sp.]|nr:hypothetical protein [Sphingomonas sp.]
MRISHALFGAAALVGAAIPATAQAQYYDGGPPAYQASYDNGRYNDDHGRDGYSYGHANYGRHDWRAEQRRERRWREEQRRRWRHAHRHHHHSDYYR